MWDINTFHLYNNIKILSIPLLAFLEGSFSLYMSMYAFVELLKTLKTFSSL